MTIVVEISPGDPVPRTPSKARDVRVIQEHDRLEGLVLKMSTISKFILYATLFLAAGYWSVKGDFVDSWDAWLWLIAFIFIELNVFDWRQEALEQEVAEAT